MRVFLFAAVLTLAACDAAGPESAATLATAAPTDDAPSASGADLAAVRAATAKYHRVERALADGYGAPPFPGADPLISECVAHPDLGGMGHHYINARLANGTLDIEQPEILLYEPTKNGRLRLVGVEYLVPFRVEPTADDGGTAPTLFGQTFHENDNAGGWTLHVWVWKNNPSGMFADFNPTVSCEYEQTSDA